MSRCLRDALDYRSVNEEMIAGLLFDLGHTSLELLPAIILDSFMIRHEDSEDLRLLLPVRPAFAAFERDDDLPCGLRNGDPFDFAL